MFEITFLERSKMQMPLVLTLFFVLKWKLSALVSALDMSSAVAMALQVLIFVSLHQLCSCDSVDCTDLFSNHFLRTQTAGLLTGRAGSKTPPRVLCSSISVAPGAVLPPGIQLPCGTWGTGHRGQLKIFGSSFKGC